MKTLKLILMFIAILIGFSCYKDDSELYEKVKISLLPSIGITQGVYTPLRSISIIDTIYAVQIYEEGTPYYYGLFNDVSKMEIALITNKKYTFKVTSYLKGSGSGLKTIDQNGLKTYFLPDSVTLLNKFIKGDKLIGISNVGNVKLAVNKYSLYPEIDLFYQETEVTVTKGMSSLEIPLKRTGFGLGISVDGLKSGKIEVYFAGDTINLSPTNSYYSSIRSFIGGTKGLFDIASVDTYFVETPLSAKWIGDNGTTISATKTIKLKRNYQLPFFININTTNQTINFDKWYTNPPAYGLVAWYPFNGNANDESGNGNNGIVKGATLTTNRFGASSSAYSFISANKNYIELTPTLGTFGTSDFSISAWINQSAVNSVYIVSKRNTENYANFWEFLPNAFSICQTTTQASSTSIFTTYQVGYNEWHHIAAVKTSGTLSIFIDGILNATKTISTGYYNITNSNPCIIGAQIAPISGAKGCFDGKIDDIGLWNRALTQNEITSLYQY